jgi:hypothetical protein
MGRRFGAEVACVALAILFGGGCYLPVARDEECVPTTIYHTDPVSGRTSPIGAVGCESPVDPDAKLEPGYACGGLDKQLGPVTELSNGTSGLVDAFLTDDAVIIVSGDRIELVDRQAKRLARIRWDFDLPQDAELGANVPIHTAAFDGELLVVTSGRWLMSYDRGLNELARTQTPERCETSIMVSEGRFVCGGPEDFGRTYYPFDARTASPPLATKESNFEEGPMRRVPGRDAFLTVNTHVTPRSFNLFSVDAAGTIKMIGNSSALNHGTFRISPVYAFPTASTHLITDQGLLICLTAEDCEDATYALKPDGDIGLLPGTSAFAAMDVDPDNKLHAISGTITESFGVPTCKDGCTMQRIDVSTGVVEEAVEIVFEKTSVIQTWRKDPQGGMLLGCSRGGTHGHRVMLLGED